MRILVSFVLGILFALGLSVSGMVNPNKVIGFLDLFRNWDPALIFVMGGAVGVNTVLFKFILKRKHPLMGGEFSLPLRTLITWPLIVGSIIFGIGWGLSGICPGPGIANLFSLSPKIIAFVVSMLVGVVLFIPFEKAFNLKGKC